MKKVVYYFVLVSLFMLNTASMCSSDDDSSSDNPSTGTVTQNTTSGTWRITLYQEDGSNETSNFSGYNFTISSNNSISAVNGSTTKTGIWSTYTDSGKTKFDIAFPDTDGYFESISEDFDVLSSTTSRLELKHISGGDGSIDLLTFEKN